MRVTLKDIAKELNVSVNTVSKALNNKSKVSKNLKEKILETAENLGYEKNIFASSLSKKPVKIGVLIIGYDKNYYQYTLKGLDKAATDLKDNKVNFDVRVVGVDKNTEANSLKITEEFINNNIDGIIFNDYHFSNLKEVIENLNRKKIFSALLNYDVSNVNPSFSMTNDYNIATALACDIIKMNIKNQKNKSVIIYSQPVEVGEKFRNYFTENARKNNITDIISVTSDEELIGVLKSKEVGGIYVSMATYLGVCEYLKKNYKEDNKPCLVVSDIYDKAAEYIESNIIDGIIYQEPERQAYRTAVTLYKAVFENKVTEKKLKINPIVILKSNYKNYL